MLARPVEQLPATDALPGGCQFEPKLDGYLHWTLSGGRSQVGDWGE